ncbi:dipeptidase [Anaeromicrobium sediminis]|uniref:Membrane dipeptidase n=1 Tax=Anaeromicrobium sediminis TaxID=1478221 RepID=A0A267MC44_9FIRM|nr:membrane dipeptidase [Anaeromicrobium sediminis]PAB57027.1 hypothetical protein CCE28_19805 [Anaeromicrobium sediminis]
MLFRKVAESLFQKNFIVDAHYDLGEVIYNRTQLGEKEIIKNHLLEIYKKTNVKLIVAAIFVDSHYLCEKALRIALDQINLIYKDVESVSDSVMIVKDLDDLKTVQSIDKIGIILSLEGLAPIMDDIHLLEIFNRLGVLGAGLVWSRRNAVGEGSRFDGKLAKGGLSVFGCDVVKKMESLNMFVDVSHLNDAGVEDVISISKRPFIASHSNARSINYITRNLSDEHIKAIAASGGIIGINNIKPIVGAEVEDYISKICDHIDHMKGLIGCEQIGFGFDLCNDLGKTGVRYGTLTEEPIDALESYEDIILIIEELLKREYSEEDIKKIMGLNLMRFFESVLARDE